ncbi:unnamed protein product, partial [Urochloa humidicola]
VRTVLPYRLTHASPSLPSQVRTPSPGLLLICPLPDPDRGGPSPNSSATVPIPNLQRWFHLRPPPSTPSTSSAAGPVPEHQRRRHLRPRAPPLLSPPVPSADPRFPLPAATLPPRVVAPPPLGGITSAPTRRQPSASPTRTSSSTRTTTSPSLATGSSARTGPGSSARTGPGTWSPFPPPAKLRLEFNQRGRGSSSRHLRIGLKIRFAKAARSIPWKGTIQNW